MKALHSIFRLAAMLGVLSLGSELAAAEPANRLAELFAAGDIPSPQALEKATQVYDSLAKEGGASNLDYAYAIVLMRQRKYDAAIEKLHAILKRQPNDFAAQRALIWSEAILKKYPAALLDMHAAAAALATAKATEEHDEALDTAEFLGRTWAFFAGPALSANKDANLDRERDKLLARMNQEQQDAFQLGKTHVTLLHAKLTLDRDNTVNENKVESEKQLADDAKRLQQEKEEIKEDQEKLDQRSEKKQAENQSSLDKVEKQGQSTEARLESLRASAQPLVSQVQVLQSQVNSAFSESTLLAQQAASLRAQADRATGADASRLRNDAQQRDLAASQAANYGYSASAAVQPLWAQLNSLQAQAAQLTGQKNALLGEQSRILDKSKREADRLAVEEETLKKQYNAVSQKEHALAGKKASGINSRVLTLNNQIRAYSTYQPFPYESEKERLIRAGE